MAKVRSVAVRGLRREAESRRLGGRKVGRFGLLVAYKGGVRVTDRAALVALAGRRV